MLLKTNESQKYYIVKVRKWNLKRESICVGPRVLKTTKINVLWTLRDKNLSINQRHIN